MWSPRLSTAASCRTPSPARSTSNSSLHTFPTSKLARRSRPVYSTFCWPAEERTMDEKQRYDAGMQVRRAVLGDAHVDRSLEKLNDFNGEFQEMITRHAWGDIWTRP